MASHVTIHSHDHDSLKSKFLRTVKSTTVVIVTNYILGLIFKLSFKIHFRYKHKRESKKMLKIT
jgi:hypothetical protein